MTTHLVIPDSHAKPGINNERADWIGDLIVDTKPDVVINLGDQWDMESMCSYDKGKKSFMHRSYRKDIDAGLEFSERMWERPRRQKKKKPTTYFFEGNHEERIRRALEVQPELDGAISYDHLDLDKYYDDVVYYNGGTPGVKVIDGISYAHYFVSGVMGRPIGGEHHAYSLLAKHYTSCTCGHSHLADYSIRTRSDGSKIMGLVAGCYIGHPLSFAGVCNHLWWNGVVLKTNVDNGSYDPQFISYSSLKKEYGNAH